MAQLMNAQLERSTEKASKSRYGKGIDLLESSRVLNFLMDHNINSVSELFDAIAELNTSYYDLRGRIKTGERRTVALLERLAKLETYNKYKSLRRKIDAMNPIKRAMQEEKYKNELAAFASAESYLKELKESGEKISQKEWEKELKRLSEERTVLNYELEAMKDKIKTAENIRKDAERIAAEYQQEEERRKAEPSL